MSAAAAGWSVPKFTKTFEGVRFQQGGDAKSVRNENSSISLLLTRRR